MRPRLDLSGWWPAKLVLNLQLDVAAPAVIEREFYVPLPWNKQIEELRWPGATQELSGVVRPVQNQNFREVMRKFNEGTITYSRTIGLPRDARPPRLFLVIEGSNYRTEVRAEGIAVVKAGRKSERQVRGRHVATHDGGHLAFETELTEAVRGADRLALAITVDNLRRKDAVPQEQFNWQNYGGIYRPIYLEWRPAVFIAGCSAFPGHDDAGWYVDVTVRLSDDTTNPVTATLGCGASEPLQSEGASRRGRLRAGSLPAIWFSGEGQLETLSVSLGNGHEPADSMTLPIGLRTVEARGSQVLLNGEPVRLLGAAWHEQHPTFGNSVPGWQVVHDLKLMKQVGLNAVRAAHYPHAQSFYDACDREGMMVLAELPCWQFNEHHFNSPAVREFCCDYAREMVRQLGHHPCIIGWVIQNESKTFEPGAAEFFRAIHDAFKAADLSRFTIAAESPEPPEHLTVVKKVQSEPQGPLPPTAAFLNVLGVNNYAGWYANKAEYLAKTLDHVHAQLGGAKPLVVTEFGAEGILGQRSLEMAPWTEDYQAELLVRHLRAILARPFVAGFFLWLFIDYEAASISIRGINAKGLVDEYRRPKLAFNEVKRVLEGLAPSPSGRGPG